MNFEVHLAYVSLLYFLNNICCTLQLQQKWSVAMDDKCVFTVSKNWTILFEQNPSLFVTYLKEKTFARCRSSCCAHQTCNGYVFDESNRGDSCKLLKCSRNGTDCKKALRKYEKDTPGEVGFITGLAGAKVDVVPSQDASGSQASIQTPTAVHEAPTQQVTNVQQNTEDEKENPTHGFTGDMGTTEGEVAEVSTQTSLTSTTSTPEKVINYTEYASNQYTTNIYREDIKEHTNSISLTIAFLFGIGFLVTVLYLTGRRWIEGFKEDQRRGYTRISYLLNGV